MPRARVMYTDRSCSAHAHGCMRDFWAWLRHAWWWFHNCHRSAPVLQGTLQLPVVLAMLLHSSWEPRIQCQYGHSSIGRGNARGKSGCRFQPSIVPPNSSMYVQSMYVCLDIINRLGNMYRNATIPYSVQSPAATTTPYSRILSLLRIDTQEIL